MRKVRIMARYFAFLRAINVGGHTVKMDALRELFEAMGFSGVETFIASGNVVFEAGSADARELETRIEGKLGEALGFEVATFVRTEAELAAIASYEPFSPAKLDAAQALNVAFLAKPLDGKAEEVLMALRTEIDDFHAHGREVYWLCLKKQSESTFSNAVFERTLGRRATFRGIRTVRKMAVKYGA
jgi:uncharacterized protein (DUF1697 family)